MPKVRRHRPRFRAYKLGWRKPLRKGMPNRKIIGYVLIANMFEYSLHATKGYRYRRV